MSIRYLRALEELADTERVYYTHFAVLFWLCSRADDDGYVVQNVKETATYAGCSGQHVYSATSKLIERGIIKLISEGYANSARAYQILLTPPPDPEPLLLPAPQPQAEPPAIKHHVVVDVDVNLRIGVRDQSVEGGGL